MNGLFDTPQEFVQEFASKWDEHNGVVDFDKLFENPENVRRALATKALQDAIRSQGQPTMSTLMAQFTGDLQRFRPLISSSTVQTNTLPRFDLSNFDSLDNFSISLIGGLYGLAYGSAVGMPFTIWQNDVVYRDKSLMKSTADIPSFPAQRNVKGKTDNLTPGLPGYPFEHAMLVYRHIIGMRAYSRDTIIGNYIAWTNALEGAWMKPDPFMKLFKNDSIDKFSNGMNWYLSMDSTSPDNGEYLCRILPLCYCENALIDDITLTNPCDIAIEVGRLFAYLYRGLLSQTPFETTLSQMEAQQHSTEVNSVFRDLQVVQSIDVDVQAFSKRRVPENEMNRATQCLYIVLAALKRFNVSTDKPERMLDAIRWAIFDSNGSTKSGMPATPCQLIGGLVASCCGMILGIQQMKSYEAIRVNLERVTAAAKIDTDPNYLTSLTPRPTIGNTPRRELSVLDISAIVSSYVVNCPGMSVYPYSRTVFTPREQSKPQQFVPSTTSGYSGNTYVPQQQPGYVSEQNMNQVNPTWVMDRPATSYAGIRQL